MKRLSPLKATCAGLLIGIALIAALGAGLTKWVGQFYGDGAGLTNITASGTISAAILTNSVLKFQLDATFEDTVKKEGSHGMLLQYDRIDGGSSTLLFRTTDDSIHFPSSTFIFDGISSPTALGLDSGGHPVAIDSSAPIRRASLFSK